ncbi:MAG TPA: hypothetical protein VEZ71_01030, partial [Archangium sp.]|nr:hypothetical protein [Archangium sp.]
MPSRAVLALGLLLLVPQWARAASPLESVAVREQHSPAYGRGLELTFKPLGPDLALARFTVEEARSFVEALETAFQAPKPRSGRPSLAGLPPLAMTAGFFSRPPPDAHSSDLERRVRAAYGEIFGPPSMPLLSSLESSRWFLALKLSPRYMAEGVRAAAM